MKPIRLARVEAYSFRVPLAAPITVSFGKFRDRPFVLVRAVDADGTEGWGECWCNWPSVGAEHRARLAADFGERLIGREFATPEDAYATLTKELDVLILQTGEIGPISQAVSGLDIAIWDMVARREGVPLHRALGGGKAERVPVYATGINPDGAAEYAVARAQEGHLAFKLKIGFGRERDLANLRAMREGLGKDAIIAVDANQAFDFDRAIDFAHAAAEFDLTWLEEPLRADAPPAIWRKLAAASPVPLAGGENLRGQDLLVAAEGDVYATVQPDLTKWGGLSGNLGFMREAVKRGKRFCPHVFGGGVALIASIHALAAVGGAGLQEMDCHPNVGREAVVGDALPVRGGQVPVPQGPGLGVVPDLKALARYRTWPASA